MNINFAGNISTVEFLIREKLTGYEVDVQHRYMATFIRACAETITTNWWNESRNQTLYDKIANERLQQSAGAAVRLILSAQSLGSSQE